MGTLTIETLRSGTEWHNSDDASTIGTVRRAAMRLAERLGFGNERSGEVGIVATEIATNVFRHAERGTIGLQVALRSGRPGVQVIAIDRGPGMTDTARFLADFHSTAGTLGVGLGAVTRLATTFDLSSAAGVGTVLVAGLWGLPAPSPGRLDVGGLTRPIDGEEVSGDTIAGRESAAGHVVMVADGLGHGPLAAAASQQAAGVFHETAATEPEHILREIHQRIGHTRGAAIAIAAIDPDFATVTLAGLGNISAFIQRDGHRQALTSFPGIAGHQARTLRQLSFELSEDALVILHSDGMTQHWDVERVAGLRLRSAAVIAGSLLRDAGLRPDDASVLVVRRAR